jgi:hypothetical protein
MAVDAIMSHARIGSFVTIDRINSGRMNPDIPLFIMLIRRALTEPCGRLEAST